MTAEGGIYYTNSTAVKNENKLSNKKVFVVSDLAQIAVIVKCWTRPEFTPYGEITQ